MVAVKIENITKKFKDVVALDNCSLQIEEGELYGLLGVNGAGKTTLIKILCTLLPPNDGEAYVCGLSCTRESEQVKRVIAVSPQETSIAPNLTVKENLQFFAAIYFKDKTEREQAIDEVVNTFSLGEVLARRAGKLSGGWQRRLSVAIALVSRPKVLFLDEPTLGLDVLARRELWQIIGKIKSKVTIILTSHYLEEIEKLCDKTAILRSGKVVAEGTVEELKARFGTDSFEDAFVRAVTEVGQ